MRNRILGSTEDPHPWSAGLDTLAVDHLARLFWQDHLQVMDAVAEALPQIEALARIYAETYQSGGRIFYVGAGTSGRLGILDAVELPPTFGIPPGRVQAILAGGESAFTQAVEAAEDDRAGGESAIIAYGVGTADLVIGISASGETPFVLGAVAAARARGAKTAAITNNIGTTLEKMVEFPVVLLTGPELVAGSTRLKAGTAQKIVLNMLSTIAMVKLGKVYNHFMIDLRATNNKLRRRAEEMLRTLTGEDLKTIKETLAQANYEVKPALLMLKGKISYEEAKKLIERHRGLVREALKELGIKEGLV